MKKAREYSEDELMDVFWSVDRDQYPDRYSEICDELNYREIQYEDLPQWERALKKQDEELDAATEVILLSRTGYGIIIAVMAVIAFIYEYFGS